MYFLGWSHLNKREDDAKNCKLSPVVCGHFFGDAKMTETVTTYVAREILEMLGRYDHHKDGPYCTYIARTAVAAVREAEKMGLPDKEPKQ